MKRIVTICFTVLLSAGIAVASAGTYYASINTSSPTFVNDLHTLINNHTKVSYDAYKTTIIPNYETLTDASGKYVVCVYSGEKGYYTGTFAWTPTTIFSREHTFCFSWMPSTPATTDPEYCDQHHLFPADQYNANGPRSNHPLGIVVTPTSIFLEGKLGKDANGKTVYEPRNSHKGDAARALMYMMLCYNGVGGYDWTLNHLNTVTLPNASETTEEQALLKQWNTEDPPDAWEIGRNDYIESIQLNRNPFVDHPEYVAMIDFNTLTLTGPVVPPVLAGEPSNYATSFAAGTITSSSVQVTWTDAAAGAQVPAGYLLMANTTGVFTAPVDGAAAADDANLADGSAAVNVSFASANAYTFSGLPPSTTYYFQIVSANGTGTSINYKTDGTVPAVAAATSAVVVPPGALVPGAFTGIYEFTGTSSGDNQLNSVTAQPGFGTFSTITRTGVTWVSASNMFNSAGWSLGAARVDAKYVSFTLTLNSGYAFQNLPLALAFESQKSATGPVSGEVEYRYGSAAVATAGTFTPTTSVVSTPITIPAPGNATSTSVEIRIFGWGGTNTGGTLRFDDVTLSTPDIALPVELTSFNAQSRPGGVELRWNTATEANNYGFEIERSPAAAAGRTAQAARQWIRIGFVEGSGTSNTAHQYSFIDRTAGASAYRLKQIDRDGGFEYSPVVEAQPEAAPSGFTLGQNYPNPFNPATVITYQTAENAHVLLTVYDALGREVAALVNDTKQAGMYSVTWNAKDVPSGMYFYRLTAGKYSGVKKMMFQK